MSSVSAVLRRLVLLVTVSIAALGLTACPGPTFVVQQYSGPQRPPETVAILRVKGSDPVRLLLLDGEDVAAPIVEDGRLHIEMLPGRHTVVAANASAPGERHGPLAFEAEPGKVYRVVLLPGPSGREARVYEVDRARDIGLRDVTQPAAAGGR